MVIMVLYSVYSFLINQFFKVIPIDSQLHNKHLHSFMVAIPSFTKDLTFFNQLPVKIIRKLLKSVLELFLECVQSSMYVVHSLNSLLLILGDLTKIDVNSYESLRVDVGESKLEKAFTLNACILHVFKV